VKRQNSNMQIQREERGKHKEEERNDELNKTK
jgi:hypothetical protein